MCPMQDWVWGVTAPHGFPTPTAALVAKSRCPAMGLVVWGLCCDLQEQQNHFHFLPTLVSLQLLRAKLRDLLPNKPLFQVRQHPRSYGQRRYPSTALTSPCRNRMAPHCSLKAKEAQMSRTTRSPEYIREASRKHPQRHLCSKNETGLQGLAAPREAGQRWHEAEHCGHTGGGNLVMGRISWDCHLCHQQYGWGIQ